MFKILEISLNFFDFHIAILIFCCFFRKRDSLKYYFKRSLFHSCPILPKSLQISIGFFFNIFEIQISIGQSSFLVISGGVQNVRATSEKAEKTHRSGWTGWTGSGFSKSRPNPTYRARTLRMTAVCSKLPQINFLLNLMIFY